MDKYYISTGAGEIYYTLRYTFDEPYFVRGGNGNAEAAGVLTRDYHVQNLSLDREEAIAKARKIAGNRPLDLDDTFVLENRRKDAESIDWSIFRGGKYAGKSIHEVAEVDRGYLVWLCGQEWGQGSNYRKTAELAAALVRKELDAIADQKSQEEAAKARRIEKAKPLIDLFNAIVITVSQTKVGYRFVPCEPYERKSWGGEILVEALRKGEKVAEYVIESAIEDLLKYEGHHNRSAKSKAARQNRYEQVRSRIDAVLAA